jgi:hypothetical protein
MEYSVLKEKMKDNECGWSNLQLLTREVRIAVCTGRGPTNKCKARFEASILFVWLINHQPAVLFSQNKSDTSNQPTVIFSQNKSAPAISHQPNE